MAGHFRAESLRVLCLDGGGIKGYTSLLILRRIFRTMMVEGQLDEVPRPCDVFDLIIGTSTGGLIAVMLGRLHMTIEECITKYEELGGEVFGNKPHGGKLGRMSKALLSSCFYDIKILQEQVMEVLDFKGIERDTTFLEKGVPLCKVMLCVTRTEIRKPDVLRNYTSLHPTAENYSCTIWEAASATAAAPLYFKSVQFKETKEKWCDGGLQRNNPINEALSELAREREWKDRKIGCVLSLGTGVKKTDSITSSPTSILKGVVAMVTDSDDIAKVFASSELGARLFRTHRYFRFSIPQGMQDLKLDDWKKTDRMSALTTDYLAHASNGDMLARCAKSLLDPDENLHIDIKPKPCLLPYNTCTHFIARPMYSERLVKFFRSKSHVPQTFVLCGLGGIGKTQIALKFAETMKHQLAVFWIRADRFVNFAADYAQISKVLGGVLPQQARLDGESNNILETTRRRLEEDPEQWLLILDNADDMDAFLGRDVNRDENQGLSISQFLPRKGRMLITTRDRRFQGTVAAASDGLKVEPMNEEEATKLLLASIPDYLTSEHSNIMSQTQQLVQDLGCLPLAISQAAANIVEEHLTLGEYVSFFQDKKQRMGLMKAPTHDFQTTDPRNASQSVNITWQISFDVLVENHPLSAVFLTYIGCLHWQHIPRILIRQLPEFRDMPESEFIQLTKKPLNLSLLDEVESDPGFVEYMVHPVVHGRILGQSMPAEVSAYVGHLVDVIWTFFPNVQERSDPDWLLATYLAPHATHLIELCEETSMSSKSLSVLLLGTSRFYGASNIFDAAVHLAEKAQDMGREEWDSSPEMIVAFMLNTNQQYMDASKHTDAEQTVREALEFLESDLAKSSIPPAQLQEQRISLQSALANCMKEGGDHAMREQLHRSQLASGIVDEWTTRGIIIRHNLAHSLYHQVAVSRRVYLIMLNLRSMIIRDMSLRAKNKTQDDRDSSRASLREELLRLHRLVFKESFDVLGIEDIDTWKAANNLTSCLTMFFMVIECHPILSVLLTAGIVAKVRAEGKFKTVLNSLTITTNHCLESLDRSQIQDSVKVDEFR
ncbi:FabD/lysophospholipase-like protein [Decorospora gaudefroyi]|uniref:FabD/lysophospholipase-like protein n=1 Tax=Decorospora gaudefroyi TaxID=184978 RepID=A0A6A5KAP0_9PLEO|nr:FabD/lysophospholipase-like protein [Decorospora gaudefroyi]